MAGGLVVAFLLGMAVGRGITPGRPGTPGATPSLAGIVEELEFATRRTAAVVEILDDMAHGRVASDRPALATLRDSMQEITEELGDIRSQLQALRS
ncbi:MAG: hypothetical protein QN122_02300 [Armatimonadota bacterium]|nr:hypothetical protein [Armatimonadota bacterium]MDR7447856.1 hypothetical protein [Armatimonadota bacterium]MDR7479795.1 hypothetical protein [Armatimonadota bacterium]MDR7487542.1 hypothetical protein [Armatimonadota bacterium]MDR7490273.1 hypothetical protein [Armatimonadota bacterium]